MAGHRKHLAREGMGLRFDTAKSRAIGAEMVRVAAINATRVSCPHCDLTVLPDRLDRHIAIVHDKGDA